MIRKDLPEAVRKRRRRKRRPVRRGWAVAAKVLLLLLLVESICRLRWWWWWWWWELKVFSAAGCGVANVRGAGKSCRWQVKKKQWERKSLAAMFALSNCRFLLLLLFSCCLPVLWLFTVVGCGCRDRGGKVFFRSPSSRCRRDRSQVTEVWFCLPARNRTEERGEAKKACVRSSLNAEYSPLSLSLSDTKTQLIINHTDTNANWSKQW